MTCAPDHIPQALIDQLQDGGRMIIPVDSLLQVGISRTASFWTPWQLQNFFAFFIVQPEEHHPGPLNDLIANDTG